MIYKRRIPTLSLVMFLLLAVAAANGQQHPAQAAPEPPPHPVGKSAPAPGAAAAGSAPAHEVVASSSEIIGSLTGANLYTNPALGMSLQLTGEWQFMDAETRRMAEGRPAQDDADATKEQEGKRRSECMGPVCGDPEINVALFTELNPTMGASSVFIAAFKLAPEYLDRERYPLKKFAEIMLTLSAPDAAGAGGQSAEAAADRLTDVRLGGRPAYRMLVRAPGDQSAKEVGYVVESNGYILLLVASTSQPADLPKLQGEIEGVKFK